jgi:site-specific recombinase XerD
VVVSSNLTTPTISHDQQCSQNLQFSQIQFRYDLLTHFVNSRREGLSSRTLEYYRYCLTPYVNRYDLTADGINAFLSNLTCGNSKCNYYNAIAVFVRWLIKTGYLKDNPLNGVDKPKIAKRLLPSLTEAQVELLITTLRI